MKNIFYYIFGLFVLSACSPNQDENGDFLHGMEYDTSITGTNTTIKKIKKVTTVDSGGDKVVATYNYSGARLTSVTSDDNSFSYNLTYSGDDITKIVYKTEDAMSGDVTINTQNLTYVGGKVVKSEGNTTKSDGTVVYVSSTNYNYSADKIKSIVTKVKDDTNTTDLFTIQTDYTFSGNNVTNFKYTMTSAPGPVTVSPITFTSTLSGYDTYKNPLGTLPLAFKLVSSHFDMENNVVYGFSTNNYKTIKAVTNLGNWTATLTYDYDKDGYPKTGTSAEGSVAFEYVK